MSNKLKGKSLRKALTLAYSILLVGISGLAVLDTLFISKSYTKFNNEITTTNQSASSSGTSTATVKTATAYEDDTKAISIETYERNSTQIHVATVTIKGDASIKTALADETYGRNIKAKTSTTAQSVNAVLAVNGDYYGARDAGYVFATGNSYEAIARTLIKRT